MLTLLIRGFISLQYDRSIEINQDDILFGIHKILMALVEILKTHQLLYIKDFN